MHQQITPNKTKLTKNNRTEHLQHSHHLKELKQYFRCYLSIIKNTFKYQINHIHTYCKKSVSDCDRSADVCAITSLEGFVRTNQHLFGRFCQNQPVPIWKVLSEPASIYLEGFVRTNQHLSERFCQNQPVLISKVLSEPTSTYWKVLSEPTSTFAVAVL